MTTWRKLITEEMTKHGDSFDNLAGLALGITEKWDYDTDEDIVTPGSLDTEFDSGFGSAEGCPFTFWTYTRVYFPVVYDGAEWVGSVPRYPDSNEAAKHFGGQ